MGPGDDQVGMNLLERFETRTCLEKGVVNWGAKRRNRRLAMVVLTTNSCLTFIIFCHSEMEMNTTVAKITWNVNKLIYHIIYKENFYQ